ncbi:MAG: RagB/SusD family nutrient uptake outer membrane protein, partial [Bacteroidales bacterium]|nr:RagB/SusD family nutrient uptake outer membrane protein [Bacteroidales bacterium]
IMLMKAECLIREGDADLAKPLIDAVRQRAGLDALPSTPQLEEVYNERGFELIWEGHRRQDMIRFGTYTQAHGLAPVTDSHFELFPIPTSAINDNTSLKQNQGF